jgi:tetratricopeptide (TPR) repeat protein
LFAACVALLSGCQKISKLLGDEPSREDQAKALIERGNNALEADNLEVAAQLFEQAATLSASNPEPQLALGRIHARTGNDGQAILALKRVVELVPGNVEARSLLAELYMRHGNPETAIEHLRKALDATEGKPPAELMRRLATALLRAGELDEAEATVERIDREGPGDPETLALFAEVLIAKGDEDRAVRLLDVAAASSSNSPRVRTARAKYFLSRGKVEEALRELDIAVKADPENATIALERARALAAAGRFQEAAGAMEEIVHDRPTDLDAQATLAEIKLMAGDNPGAQQAAEAVISRQPHNGKALYVRARAIEDQSPDDPVRAINAYRQVLEAEENQLEALSRLWRLYSKNGEKSEAISVLEHLLFLGDATAEEEVELAALYGETGINAARGQKLIAAAMKRDPGNPRLITIKRDLDAKARQMPARGGGGSGIQVLKGGH